MVRQRQANRFEAFREQSPDSDTKKAPEIQIIETKRQQPISLKFKKRLERKEKNKVEPVEDNLCKTCYSEIDKKDQVYKCPCNITICDYCAFDWAKAQIFD